MNTNVSTQRLSLFLGDNEMTGQIKFHPHTTRPHTHSPHTFLPTPTFTPTLTRSFAHRAWALRDTLHGSHTSHTYIRTSPPNITFHREHALSCCNNPLPVSWLVWLWVGCADPPPFSRNNHTAISNQLVVVQACAHRNSMLD
jgi:hypothetical protein